MITQIIFFICEDDFFKLLKKVGTLACQKKYIIKMLHKVYVVFKAIYCGIVYKKKCFNILP